MNNPVSAETIKRALAFIPAEDRDLWVRMGMAVQSELGEEGFDVWDEWSRRADNYREADAKPYGAGLPQVPWGSEP